MPDTALADLGFADFVAVLLVETLDSIVASHTSQAERLRALDAAADLTPEEFAATGVTGDVVTAMLVQLFPDGNGGTTIAPGATAPDDDDLAELDIVLARADVEAGNLTERGATTVSDGVRLFIARRQLRAMQQVAERGIPRVLVDGGTLKAKVTFTAEHSDATTDAPSPAAGPVRRLPTLASAGTLRGALAAFDSPLRGGVLDSIRTTRLKVTNLGGTDPAPTERAEVYGEVEIRFRTEV
ncbi:hypothetical protein [Microbacterium sp.]|uniref:hypothetical protein n=1 Tax=Microbacterium sp. TaxID=51671 RepID=UPI003A852516